MNLNGEFKVLYNPNFVDSILFSDINLPEKLLEDNPEIYESAVMGNLNATMKIVSLMFVYQSDELSNNEIKLYRLAASLGNAQAMILVVTSMLKLQHITKAAEFCWYYLNSIKEIEVSDKDFEVANTLTLIAKKILADHPNNPLISFDQYESLFAEIDAVRAIVATDKIECDFKLSENLRKSFQIMNTGEVNNISDSVIEAFGLYNSYIHGSSSAAFKLASLYDLGLIDGEDVDLLSAAYLYAYAAKNDYVDAMPAHLSVLIALNDCVNAIKFSVVYLSNLLIKIEGGNSLKTTCKTLVRSVIAVMKFTKESGLIEKIDISPIIKAFEKLNDYRAVDDSLIAESFALTAAIKIKQDPSFVIVAKDRFVESGEFKMGQFKTLWQASKLVDSPISSSLKVLDEQFPWMKPVTRNVSNQIRAREFGTQRAFKIRPILLVGLPGGGKTSYCRALADLLKVPFRVFMGAGSDGSQAMRGVARGYSTASPGFVPRMIAQENTANGLILVDEIDKCASGRHNGSLLDVMLQLLEPATSSVYYDEALEVRLDLSHINWIATANSLADIPKPLLSRFEIILAGEPDSDGYTKAIIKTRLDYANEIGVDARMMPELDNEDVESIKNNCKSLRQISKVTRRILEDRMCAKKPVMH